MFTKKTKKNTKNKKIIQMFSFCTTPRERGNEKPFLQKPKLQQR